MLRTNYVQQIKRQPSGENLHDLGLGITLSDVTLKAHTTKKKLDKLDFFNIKKKPSVQQRHHQESENITNTREKIFVSYISDKGLGSRVPYFPVHNALFCPNF